MDFMHALRARTRRLLSNARQSANPAFWLLAAACFAVASGIVGYMAGIGTIAGAPIFKLAQVATPIVALFIAIWSPRAIDRRRQLSDSRRHRNSKAADALRNQAAVDRDRNRRIAALKTEARLKREAIYAAFAPAEAIVRELILEVRARAAVLAPESAAATSHSPFRHSPEELLKQLDQISLQPLGDERAVWYVLCLRRDCKAMVEMLSTQPALVAARPDPNFQVMYQRSMAGQDCAGVCSLLQQFIRHKGVLCREKADEYRDLWIQYELTPGSRAEEGPR